MSKNRTVYSTLATALYHFNLTFSACIVHSRDRKLCEFLSINTTRKENNSSKGGHHDTDIDKN